MSWLKLTTKSAIAEGHGDTAVLLLKAGADTTKKDVDGHLAIALAPDDKVISLKSTAVPEMLMFAT